jgi:hypothetical protein
MLRILLTPGEKTKLAELAGDRPVSVVVRDLVAIALEAIAIKRAGVDMNVLTLHNKMSQID